MWKDLFDTILIEVRQDRIRNEYDVEKKICFTMSFMNFQMPNQRMQSKTMGDKKKLVTIYSSSWKHHVFVGNLRSQNTAITARRVCAQTRTAGQI